MKCIKKDESEEEKEQKSEGLLSSLLEAGILREERIQTCNECSIRS
jgi:hypothetical protein